MSVHPPARFSRAGYSTVTRATEGGPPSRVSFSFTAAPETSGLFAFARWFFARALASAPKIGSASANGATTLSRRHRRAPPPPRGRRQPAGARRRGRDATGGDERLRVRGVFFFVRVIVVILGSGVPRPAPARAAPLRPLVAPGEERPPSDGDAPRDVRALLPS